MQLDLLQAGLFMQLALDLYSWEILLLFVHPFEMNRTYSKIGLFSVLGVKPAATHPY